MDTSCGEQSTLYPEPHIPVVHAGGMTDDAAIVPDPDEPAIDPDAVLAGVDPDIAGADPETIVDDVDVDPEAVIDETDPDPEVVPRAAEG